MTIDPNACAICDNVVGIAGKVTDPFGAANDTPDLFGVCRPCASTRFDLIKRYRVALYGETA